MDYKTTAEPKAWAGEVPVFCAHDDIVDVLTLIPNPKNPNTHPEEQVELLGRIIRATGWRQPITVSKRSGFIVKGHGRHLAAQAAGLTKVPVDYQDYASEAEEYADLVADNRLAELSEIDKAMMADVFKEIDPTEIPVELTGYTEEEFDDLKDLFSDKEIIEEIEEDMVPPAEIDEESFTKPGDVWLLGRHKLICGDSTKMATYKALMGEEVAKLIITDPPYNVDYTGATEARMKIKNDSMDDASFRRFLTDAFTSMATYAEPGAAFYIWHADSEGLNFRLAAKEAGFKVRECLIWVKNQLCLGRADYQWIHEPCLYGWKDGAGHYFIDDRKQTTVYDGAGARHFKADEGRAGGHVAKGAPAEGATDYDHPGEEAAQVGPAPDDEADQADKPNHDQLQQARLDRSRSIQRKRHDAHHGREDGADRTMHRTRRALLRRYRQALRHDDRAARHQAHP